LAPLSPFRPFSSGALKKSFEPFSGGLSHGIPTPTLENDHVAQNAP
jgi:hypothetical protein